MTPHSSVIPIHFRGETLDTYLSLDESVRQGMLQHLMALRRGIALFSPGEHDFFTESSGFRLLCAVDAEPEPLLSVIRLERVRNSTG